MKKKRQKFEFQLHEKEEKYWQPKIKDFKAC